MPADEYFDRLESELESAIDHAETARSVGADPTDSVEIPVAVDMADRVENILGIDGVADRVRALDGEMSREEAALRLVEDFVEGTVGEYETPAGKIDGAVRTAVALLTEGVVAAPIEGIDRVEVRSNDDGSEFVAVYYAGPIRSAGGTAQALSVLVADYARSLLGLSAYNPREEEVERYVEEVGVYDDETGLQYSPSEDETRFIARHCPVLLDGEATGEQEVEGYRDLERVDTNAPRGGMCLVLAEGLALKAPKIQRYTRELAEVDWPWLQDLIDGTYAEDAPPTESPVEATQPVTDDDRMDAESNGRPTPESSGKYLRDLIAGRPVFGHPSSPGGFRLRYGRARNHGFATVGIHPATMHILDDFLAPGTQLKTERPGKAAGVVPVDSIDGPTVKLANGDVRHIDDVDTAKELHNGVEAILDLGEYLVNYGEFVENNQPLAPAAYTLEWWIQDMAASGATVQALRDSPHVDLDDPTPDQALAWASDHDAPLHPAYTYLYHDITPTQFQTLADAVATGDIEDDALSIEATEDVRTILETLLVAHHQSPDTITIEDWRPLARSLGLTETLDRSWDSLPDDVVADDDALDAVNHVAPFTVQARAPTRVGARMGRPEKSESRDLNPAVHTLFPIGDAGGNQRDVNEAASSGDPNATRGAISVDLGNRECPACHTTTFQTKCPDCDTRTDPVYECPDCEVTAEPDDSGRVTCPNCEQEVDGVDRYDINVDELVRDAHESVGERGSAYDILKGVKGLTSQHKTPEPIEKGILRAKHDVTAFKDGTVRYDITDLPVTTVTPEELGVTADQFRELGYDTDIHGETLRHDDQLLELNVQDIILSDGAADHLLNTADFVDDLLTEYYGLDPYYEAQDRDDLVGELVFGLAPHTSAAVVGRVVGFTSAAVGYAHPYFHAAKRRNCFHPATKLWYGDETGDTHYGRIDEFVETRLDPATADEDEVGTLIQDLDGEVTVPSITVDGDKTTQVVEAVSKHPAPNHMVRIETRSGRELTVTPDHSMRRWNDDTVERIKASDLTVGDMALAPTDTPVDGETVSVNEARPQRVCGDGGSITLDAIAAVDIVPAESEYTYSLTVSETNTLVANDLYTGQCDGDEDCVMLVMDGLLNFSKEYLPDNRGGRMDAPLVMSSRVDPTEIDDEAHNIDVVDEYPRSFFEATREMADPEAVDLELAGDSVGTPDQYSGFGYTHETSGLALGPELSAYKTLGSMTEKMDAQLELARKLRAVDESDVAERVIESHFLPDLIGNLRAFSRQETRCLDCGRKYRRMPLSGECRECGGTVNLTVHEGSVSKYMETATTVAEEYGARAYTRQRLAILEKTLDSLFVNDKNRQSGIADFM